jgi:hypothetical protein
MKLWNFRARDLAEEMRFHQEQLEAEGQSPLDAAKAFGNDLLLRQRSRDAWGWLWLPQLAQDLRHCLRQFRRAPAFTAAAVIILAVGIGANAALFSVFSAVLLHPLPFAHPDRLVLIEGPTPLDHHPVNEDLVGTYSPWTREIPGLEAIGFYFSGPARFALGNAAALPPQQVMTAEVSPGFLRQ